MCFSVKNTFPTNPNSVTNFSKLFFLLQLHCSCITFQCCTETSYEQGLYLILSVVRSIFWPDISTDWTENQKLHVTYNVSHGIELKRRIIYYLSGALWNQFQKEMAMKHPLNRRSKDWYGDVSGPGSKYETTSTRATPSLRYLHEIIKIIDRACLPSLMEEKLLHTIHLMMSHESRVTHMLSLRGHKRKICTEMGVSESIWKPETTWPTSPMSSTATGSANSNTSESSNSSKIFHDYEASVSETAGWCRSLPCSSHYEQNPEEYDLYQYPCSNRKKKEGGLQRTLSCLYVQMASRKEGEKSISSSDNNGDEKGRELISTPFLHRSDDVRYLSDVNRYVANGMEHLRKSDLSGR